MRWWVWLVAGCNQLFGVHDLTVGGGADASLVDATVDGATLCLGDPGSIAIEVCFASPLTDRTLSGQVDTDHACDAVIQQANGPAVCVIAGADVTVASLAASGSRPLAVFASSKISVVSTLDASSHDAGLPGPGANTSACHPAIDAGTSGIAGGGGAGGSFQSLGGNGGVGDSGAASEGLADPVALPLTVLAGGCPGSVGGRSTGTMSPPANGGGAVYLVAASSITVAAGATVTTGGQGGNGGESGGGGGNGGAAGGLIVLDAPTIMIQGDVLAVGGGGGGGGSPSAAGQPGRDGFAGLSGGGGIGGAPGGGQGGDASTSAATAGGTGAPGQGAAGGGGGAGGAGYIVVIGDAVVSGTTEPAPIMRFH